MLKQAIIATSLTLGLCAGNASAAFVQYDLNNVTFSDGAVASGYFYQDTSNDAVVYYNINVPRTSYMSQANFRPSGSVSNVTSIYRSFGGEGPSSFTVDDNSTDFYIFDLRLIFSRSTPGGVFSVAGMQSQRPIPELPSYSNGFSAQRDIISGTSTLGIANAEIVAGLEAGFRDFSVKVPEPFRGTVPEPTTYALLSIGLLGYLASRKRKV